MKSFCRWQDFMTLSPLAGQGCRQLRSTEAIPWVKEINIALLVVYSVDTRCCRERGFVVSCETQMALFH